MFYFYFFMLLLSAGALGHVFNARKKSGAHEITLHAGVYTKADKRVARVTNLVHVLKN